MSSQVNSFFHFALAPLDYGLRSLDHTNAIGRSSPFGMSAILISLPFAITTIPFCIVADVITGLGEALIKTYRNGFEEAKPIFYKKVVVSPIQQCIMLSALIATSYLSYEMIRSSISVGYFSFKCIESIFNILRPYYIEILALGLLNYTAKETIRLNPHSELTKFTSFLISLPLFAIFVTITALGLLLSLSIINIAVLLFCTPCIAFYLGGKGLSRLPAPLNQDLFPPFSFIRLGQREPINLENVDFSGFDLFTNKVHELFTAAKEGKFEGINKEILEEMAYEALQAVISLALFDLILHKNQTEVYKAFGFFIGEKLNIDELEKFIEEAQGLSKHQIDQINKLLIHAKGCEEETLKDFFKVDTINEDEKEHFQKYYRTITGLASNAYQHRPFNELLANELMGGEYDIRTDYALFFMPD